jgi:hypothetical protein
MTAVAWVLGLFGSLALLLALSCLAAGRRRAAAGHAALTALLGGAAAATGALAADLASYQPREGERPIAELYFEQVGARRYRATLTRLPGGRMQVFDLTGDAWRIDARTMDFGGWARAIGGRPSYRLDRLVAIERTTTAPPPDPGSSAGFTLEAREGFDLWQRSRSSARWRELVAAGDARSDELPLTGKVRFELHLTGEKIDVVPAGDAAQERVAEESTPATTPAAR